MIQMRRPQQGDEVWEMNTKVHQVLVGRIDTIRKSKLLIGVTGSIYPVWQVVYTSVFRHTKKAKVLRTAWVVRTGGRWFTSDGEDV